MRLRMTDARERRIEMLKEATGENTKSKALDVASEYYLRMAGGTTAFPEGSVQSLMELAIEEGSVTPEQIAEVLDAESLPIRYHREFSIGAVED